MDVAYGTCVVIACPRYVPGVIFEPRVRVIDDAEGLQLRCDLQPAACKLNRLDDGSRPELCRGAQNDGLAHTLIRGAGC